MRKILFSLLMIFVILIPTGCSSSGNYPITESESDAIAQYCAYLLMKYDNNHTVDEKLLDLKDLEKVKQERQHALDVIDGYHIKPTAKPEETTEPEQQVTPEPTSKPDTQDKPDSSKDINPTPTPDADSFDNSETVAQGDSVPTESVNIGNLTSVYDSENFEFSLEGCNVSDSYKSPYEYFTLTAPNGKNIVTVNIKLKNITSKTAEFNFEDYKVKYSLICDGKRTIEPELSLLANDLSFLKQDFKAGEQYDAVIVFFADESFTHFRFRAEADTIFEQDLIRQY